MAITQSTIRVYEDSAKTTLIATEVTSGSATSIHIDGLPEGSELYATAQVTDDSSLTSVESAVYQFYTLPNVVYFSQPVGTTDGTISAQLDSITDVVAVDYWGLRYSTDQYFTTYTDTTPSQRGDIDILGLTEHTTYYVEPYIIDEFGRKWVNDEAAVTVAVPYAKPVITWTGTSSIGTTTWTQQVNIQSTAAITDAYIQYGPQGGTQTTHSLSNQTGTQTISLSNLTPGTTYTFRVYATNVSGTSNSSILTATTSGASAGVSVAFNALSNTTNSLDVTSTATLDASATITGHTVSAHLRSDGADTPVESHTQSTPSSTYSPTFGHLDADTEYYIFSTVTYTLGSDPTVLTATSTALIVETYSLVVFGNATVTNNSASIPYATDGVATNLNFDYSADSGTTWSAIAYSSLSSGTLSLTGLTPNQTYMLRGRAQNARAGLSGYTTTSFTTSQVIPVVNITNVVDITPTEATALISVS